MNSSSRIPPPVRPQFRDRADAGEALALSLSLFATEANVIVLGLARGGVPIARQVADAIEASFGVVVSRTVGVPRGAEFPLGPGTDDGHESAPREWLEFERSGPMYQAGGPLPLLHGRTVILVDEGLATGATLRAAARAIRNNRPRRVIAAVPVASRFGATNVRGDVDDLVAVVTPDAFESVSAYYEDYGPVSDEDVFRLLGQCAIQRARSATRTRVDDIRSVP